MPEATVIFSPEVMQVITVGVMIGSGGGIIRAFTNKEKLAGFLPRIVTGGIMGAILAYALRNSEILPDFGKVFLYFTGGFACAEFAQMLSDASGDLFKSILPKSGADNTNKKDAS